LAETAFSDIEATLPRYREHTHRLRSGFGVSKLYAAQFDLQFNPTVLSAVSVTEGNFLRSGGVTLHEFPSVNQLLFSN